MDYENFKEQFVADVKERFAEQGSNMNVTINEVDKLTDSVYHYDSQAKIFELGEKFVERQAQREETELKDSTEKDEKNSLLDDLKAKKEEVSKTPKKDNKEKGAKTKGDEVL